MKAARLRSSGSVGRNGTGRKARIWHSATRGLCLVALAMGLAACATPLPGGLTRVEAELLAFSPKYDQVVRLSEISSEPLCAHSDLVILESLTAEEAVQALKVICRVIRDPESSAEAWQSYKESDSPEDEQRRVQSMHDLRNMEVVGLGKIAAINPPRLEYVLGVTFCPKPSSPRPRLVSEDCPAMPRTYLEVALTASDDVTGFNVYPASEFHVDYFGISK